MTNLFNHCSMTFTCRTILSFIFCFVLYFCKSKQIGSVEKTKFIEFDLFDQVIMQNEDGVEVDVYVPRKCSWSGRLLKGKDHAAVQINVAQINAEGKMTGSVKTYTLCGYVRQQGRGDMALREMHNESEALQN